MKKRIFGIVILVCLLLLVSCREEEGKVNTDFCLTAIVQDVGEHIQVEVVESDYAYGVYWVLTSKATVYRDSTGKSIARDDLTSGDRVQIYYGGQVMMSYPPQIVAGKIVLQD